MAEMSKILEIVESLRVVPDMAAFDPARSFRENGIDSLDLMSLYLGIEAAFGTKFTEDELARIHTVGDVLTELDSRGL